ncbi:MAG: heme ABC exporter ATP-binding protein CcmA [Proteobacteria bacterium]|nr:heme ABC exporter ATP-binding protein CcmA [Pseudomonadota bacterium]
MSLVIERLTVERGERTIINALSFEARSGTALLLTGPNGAGKTTLLRALAGFLKPRSGTIRLKDAAADPDEGIAGECHYVGHLNGIKPTLSVAENASFWARYLGNASPWGQTHGAAPSVPASILEALDRFRLADLASIRAAYLSAGQKRRLGLVRLLLAPRRLWLLDEPAVSLDGPSRDLLAAAANEHLARGGFVLAATHQPLGFEPQSELRLAPAGSA